MSHVHTVDCYARNNLGPLAYTPVRADGLDRNLQNLKEVDFRAGLGRKGLQCVCDQFAIGDAVQFRSEPETGGTIVLLEDICGEPWAIVRTRTGSRKIPADRTRLWHARPRLSNA